MRSIFFYNHRVSEGMNVVCSTIGARKLRKERSSFTGGSNKILINWGSSSQEAHRLGQICMSTGSLMLNRPHAVALAINKKSALSELHERGVSVVPYFTDLQSALNVVNIGSARIYARTKLNGASGEGIVLMLRRDDPQYENYAALENPPFPLYTVGGNNSFVVQHKVAGCSLFTLGISGVRREYRAHVVRGKMIHIAKKVRPASTIEDSNTLVRNVHTGWVYSVNSDIQDDIFRRVGELAVSACEALGLDFGAVDIIEKHSTGELFVLEINTAPGIGEESTTLQKYCEAFQRIATED